MDNSVDVSALRHRIVRLATGASSDFLEEAHRTGELGLVFYILDEKARTARQEDNVIYLFGDPD